jgi:hypothetical protein
LQGVFPLLFLPELMQGKEKVLVVRIGVMGEKQGAVL